MNNPDQADLFGDIDDVDLMQWLLADLHDHLPGKLARFRQLTDLSAELGAGGTLMPGGEVVYNAWNEARLSFINGNYIATVLLCQGLAENILAAQLELGLGGQLLPHRIRFEETLDRCVQRQIIDETCAADLRRLMGLRNPLSHYRSINDPVNLSRRILDTQRPANNHLFADASFAVKVAVMLLAQPPFRINGGMDLGEHF